MIIYANMIANLKFPTSTVLIAGFYCFLPGLSGVLSPIQG